MKKLLALSIIPILILSGCGTKSNQIQKTSNATISRSR